MQNLAEKMSPLFKDAVSRVEEKGREWAKNADDWASQTLPKSVYEPLASGDGLQLASIRDAAEAAGNELVSLAKSKWSVIQGGQSAPTSDDASTVETEATQAKQTTETETAQAKQTARAPRTRKPRAKKAAETASSTKQKTPRKKTTRRKKSTATGKEKSGAASSQR